MNMLFAIELTPLLSFVLALLMLSSGAGFYAFFRIGQCSS